MTLSFESFVSFDDNPHASLNSCESFVFFDDDSNVSVIFFFDDPPLLSPFGSAFWLVVTSYLSSTIA